MDTIDYEKDTWNVIEQFFKDTPCPSSGARATHKFRYLKNTGLLRLRQVIYTSELPSLIFMNVVSYLPFLGSKKARLSVSNCWWNREVAKVFEKRRIEANKASPKTPSWYWSVGSHELLNAHITVSLHWSFLAVIHFLNGRIECKNRESYT